MFPHLRNFLDICLFFPMSACLLLLIGGCGGGGEDSTSSTQPTNGLVVKSFEPASESSAASGEIVRFHVELENSGDPGFHWEVDGISQPVSGQEMLLEVPEGSTTNHIVSVDITGGHGEKTTIIWRLQVSPSPENQPPRITGVHPTGPITATQGDTVSLSITASDPNSGDQLTARWLVDGWEQPEVDMELDLDTANLSVGEHQIEVIVSDGRSTQDEPSHTFHLTVQLAPVINHAPVIVSASPSGPVRITASSTLNLSVTANDPDGDSLIYHWRIDGVLQAEANRTLSYSPGDSDVGIHTIQVQVDDRAQNGDAEDPTHSWEVTVESPEPVPDPDPDPVPDPVPDPDPIPDPVPDPDPDPVPDPTPEPVALRVTWDPVTRDVLGQPETVVSYNVYVAENSGAYYLVGSVSSPEVTLDQLISGETYNVAVSANDAAGNESALSAPLTLTP